MDTLFLSTAQLITFVLQTAHGVPVTGIGSTFTALVSKNGGAFASVTGAKSEIGSGWYSVMLSAAETDTEGPLAIAANGSGAVQTNLTYQVSGTIYSPGAGPYILTATEASNILRCDIDDSNMLMLLPAIDAYIETATGRDWAADATIQPAAKSAARILLVQWHEDPGALRGAQPALSAALSACLTQLESLALTLATDGIPDPLTMSSFPAGGETDIAVAVAPLLVFSNQMAAGATSLIALQTAAGATVATTNALDVTTKRITITPTAPLSAASYYQIVLTAAADVYGQTITRIIGFRTA